LTSLLSAKLAESATNTNTTTTIKESKPSPGAETRNHIRPEIVDSSTDEVTTSLQKLTSSNTNNNNNYAEQQPQQQDKSAMRSPSKKPHLKSKPYIYIAVIPNLKTLKILTCYNEL